MADELNIPTHRWYQRQNNVQFAKQDMSKQWIYASGISRLLGSTSIYAVNGFTPAMVLDFAGETYFVDSETTTFDSAITHAATTNATMVDSDGLLKWRPHNLLKSSEDISDVTYWSVVGGAATTTTTITEDTASSTHRFLPPVGNRPSTPANTPHTIAVDIDPTQTRRYVTVGDTFLWVTVDTNTGTIVEADAGPNGSTILSSAVTTVNGLYRVSVEFTRTTTSITLIHVAGSDSAAAGIAAPTYLGDGSTIIATNMHLYRSDLGGMVNNPDRGDSYVPTTTAARYLPRRGHHVYNGTSWVNEGLLHESDARTNLLTYSSEFTNASWTVGGTNSVTITANQASGRDGEATLDKIAITDAANERHRFFTSVSATSDTYYTFSVDVIDGDQRYISLRYATAPYNWATSVFDLNSKSATQNSVGSASGTILTSGVEDMGGGVLRVWMVAKVTGTTLILVIGTTSSGTPTLSADDGAENYVGVAGTHFFAGAAQLELGSTPSSYIPTAGATATRAAETLTVPAANMPWNPLSVSIQMDGLMTYADNGTGAPFSGVQGEAVFSSWRIDSSNYIATALETFGASTGAVGFLQEQAGVPDGVYSSPTTYTPDINVPFNIASRHGSTFVNGAVDGTVLTANTTPTSLVDLSATNFSLGYKYNGTIGKLRVWSDDIGDTGIAEASA